MSNKSFKESVHPWTERVFTQIVNAASVPNTDLMVSRGYNDLGLLDWKGYRH